MTTPLDDVTTHADVPITYLQDHTRFAPAGQVGVTRYRANLPKETYLDALLINQQSDVLAVAFHGATNRETKTLPRFEWMRTLRKTTFSSLYFSDPCLHLHPKLGLAWYTGWKDFDLFPVFADWITRAATATGAKKILLLGSSGGGFAALQVSSLVEGSMALAFNCQTRVSAYRSSGVKYGHQMEYLRVVMPHLRPRTKLEDLDPSFDWAAPMGERLSVVDRYSTAQLNFVYHVQNVNDFHHVDDHSRPFRERVEHSPNRGRVRFIDYQGKVAHDPPTPKVFREHLHAAVDWLRSL